MASIEDLDSYLASQKEAILDASIYPDLGKIFGTLGSRPVYYFPDTVAKLLSAAKGNEQYYFYLTKLMTRWTQRTIDLKLLNKTLTEAKPDGPIRLITVDMVDEEVYSLFSEQLIDTDLMVEFSPQFNLLGDMVGKIIGFSKRSRLPILMFSRRLARYARELAPVFEVPNRFVSKKTRFFERMIPGVRRTKGIRWFIAVALLPAEPFLGPFSIPAGSLLTVIDP